jgi:hypothetical protein
MTKVIIVKFERSDVRPNGLRQRRVRDASSGKSKLVGVLDLQSETFGQDVSYVFARNVALARRENKAVSGVSDREPEEMCMDSLMAPL